MLGSGCLLSTMALYTITFLAPLQLTHYVLKSINLTKEFGSLGFILLAFNYLAYGIAILYSSQIVEKVGAKKIIPISFVCNM
jgi:hypothetical protein